MSESVQKSYDKMARLRVEELTCSRLDHLRIPLQTGSHDFSSMCFDMACNSNQVLIETCESVTSKKELTSMRSARSLLNGSSKKEMSL